MNRHLQALAWATTLALAPAAQAGPRLTETADALAPRDCELEANAARETGSGLPTVRGLELIAGCGVGGSTQIGVGWARATSEGLKAHQVALLGKTTLIAPEPGHTGWSLAWSLTSARSPGASTRLEEAALTAAATRTLAAGWLGHANLGWSHSRSDGLNTTQWSVGVESTSDLVLAADVLGNDRGRPWLSAGLGYLFPWGFSASLSLATQFDTPRVKTLTLGAKLAF